MYMQNINILYTITCMRKCMCEHVCVQCECVLWWCACSSVFQGVSEREEEQGKVRRSKEKQRDDEDIQNYRQWMRKARRSPHCSLWHYIPWYREKVVSFVIYLFANCTWWHQGVIVIFKVSDVCMCDILLPPSPPPFCALITLPPLPPFFPPLPIPSSPSPSPVP